MQKHINTFQKFEKWILYNDCCREKRREEDNKEKKKERQRERNCVVIVKVIHVTSYHKFCCVFVEVMSYGGFEYNQSNQPSGFGGFDAMGGGGFMDSVSSAVKQESGKKPGRGDRSIMPVTIKQLHDSTSSSDGFFIDNTQANQVRLLGIIEKVDDLSTSVNYQINDGTGTCECKFWKDSDNGTNKYAAIRY